MTEVEPTRASVGADGEDFAVTFLTRQGMQLLDRNWRCPHGEIDVVARDGDVLVVCEVKTRRSLTHGDPVEAVTAAKVARLRRLAHAWRAEHPVRARGMRIEADGVPGLRLPIRFSDSPQPPGRGAPRLGADQDADWPPRD